MIITSLRLVPRGAAEISQIGTIKMTINHPEINANDHGAEVEVVVGNGERMIERVVNEKMHLLIAMMKVPERVDPVGEVEAQKMGHVVVGDTTGIIAPEEVIESVARLPVQSRGKVPRIKRNEEGVIPPAKNEDDGVVPTVLPSNMTMRHPITMNNKLRIIQALTTRAQILLIKQ